MNRLNPLYILLLSVMIALFAAYSASKKEKELAALQSEYHTKKDLALHLSALKKAYSPKRKKELLRLLRSGMMAKSGIIVDAKKNRITISGKNIDPKAANILTSKIFNGTYNLEKLKLKRAKKGIDLEMEITWR